MTEETKSNELLDQLAEDSGAAVVVLDKDGREVSLSNNNSICSLLYSSEEFAANCAQYCGHAFSATVETGLTVEYRCHAGLFCRAVPLVDGEKRLVAIAGRTFSKADDYRQATERAIDGDWKQFPPKQLFENVLLSGSDRSLQSVVAKLEDLSGEEKGTIFSLAEFTSEIEPSVDPAEDILELPGMDEAHRPFDEFAEDVLPSEFEPATDIPLPESTPEEIAAWRSLFGSLLKLDYQKACTSILEFLASRYGLDSLLWLDRRNDHLEKFAGYGELNERLVKLGISAEEPRLIAAARDGITVELTEMRKDGVKEGRRTLSLFPVTVGGDLRGALAVGGKVSDEELVRQITRFCHTVATQVEILRLRDEVSRRDLLAEAVKRFNDNLQKIDGADFWLKITQVSAELLRAERASLLVRKEKTAGLRPMASIGVRADLSEDINIGGRVARLILDRGMPLLVRDIKRINLSSAPPERGYKSPSFISYPISIGERGVAVLNLTDKAGGEAFNERDLEILGAITPQIAVAIDRTELKERAGAYAQLSVTDSLTGLLNRRYIETRLSEEIRRSNRHGFPMSFMILDVDDFKSYNDKFGHPEGDEALKLVGYILKDTVRGADVAARYGGEEFAVLLPQTTGEEAEVIAERIRQRIEETAFPKRKVTASIGIASCTTSVHSMRGLISAADKALYEAKRKGRNNVQNYGNLDSTIENIH